MSHVVGKDFKVAILNVLKHAKKKKSMMTMSQQIENINKEIKRIFKNQVRILDLKCTIIETKNSLDGSSKPEIAEEKVSKL